MEIKYTITEDKKIKKEIITPIEEEILEPADFKKWKEGLEIRKNTLLGRKTSRRERLQAIIDRETAAANEEIVNIDKELVEIERELSEAEKVEVPNEEVSVENPVEEAVPEEAVNP